MNTFEKNLNELISSYQHSPEPSIKISSFFPAYAYLFSHLRGHSCTFVETGILNGGSLFMWREWLGPRARIIGIDLNPDAKKWASSGFEIYIGDQGSPEFWEEVLPKIGKIDAFLDDGGHESFQQIVTLQSLINHVNNQSIIVIEDTFTSFMNDFSSHKQHSFLEFSKSLTDSLTARSFGLYPNRFPSVTNMDLIHNSKKIFNISFFNGMVAININENLCIEPKLLKNRESKPTKDFRYDGQRSALIEWPDIFKKVFVKVCGR